MPHRSYPPSGTGNGRSADPQGGTGRDARLPWGLAKLPLGCGQVLKAAKRAALLGRIKVNKFNTNLRDVFSKSAWSDHINHFTAPKGWPCCLRDADALGTRSPLGREKFQGPKSNPWESTGSGGPGAVGRDCRASLLINKQQRSHGE